jgi:hypothetical protein
MEKENKILTDILFQLQGKLSDMLNCKSEMRSTENDALLYGKFPIDDKRYTVVIHVAPENYVPLTSAGAKVLSGEDYVQKGMMPSLKMPMLSATKGICSPVENEAIKNKFITEVNEVYKNSKYANLTGLKK